MRWTCRSMVATREVGDKIIISTYYSVGQGQGQRHGLYYIYSTYVCSSYIIIRRQLQMRGMWSSARDRDRSRTCRMMQWLEWIECGLTCAINQNLNRSESLIQYECEWGGLERASRCRWQGPDQTIRRCGKQRDGRDRTGAAPVTENIITFGIRHPFGWTDMQFH